MANQTVLKQKSEALLTSFCFERNQSLLPDPSFRIQLNNNSKTVKIIVFFFKATLVSNTPELLKTSR